VAGPSDLGGPGAGVSSEDVFIDPPRVSRRVRKATTAANSREVAKGSRFLDASSLSHRRTSGQWDSPGSRGINRRLERKLL